MKWNKDEYSITTDIHRIDVDFVHGILTESYWAHGRSRQTIEKSIKHSICFSLFVGQRQIGFGRVITDRAVFAWIADVIIHPDFRGQGLGKWFMQCLLGHPDVKVCNKQGLQTKDAHGLYEQFGFARGQFMRRYLDSE